ncbi:putative reverse transcriptase domain-containing protein, partial [Tanacetum coccineum]
KANVVTDALSGKERVKPRRVRAMAMTFRYGVRGMILTAQSEAFKQDNILAEILHGLDQQMERKGDESFLRYLSENEIESPWSLSEIFQGQSSEYDVIWVMTLQKVLDTRLDLSTAWHPQADRQSKRMIQTLEDIMRACVIDFGGSYHLIIRCAPFEALYGRKCRSPVLWAEIGESSLTGLELVQETTDKVVLVKEKPKAARDRQKSYLDYRRPFKIIERISHVAYSLRLPEGRFVMKLFTIKVFEEFLERRGSDVHGVGCLFLLRVVMLLFVPLYGQAKL